MENNPLVTESSIRTISGEYIDILNPDPDKIHIYDIANSLSKQCRFNGHFQMK